MNTLKFGSDEDLLYCAGAFAWFLLNCIALILHYGAEEAQHTIYSAGAICVAVSFMGAGAFAFQAIQDRVLVPAATCILMMLSGSSSIILIAAVT